MENPSSFLNDVQSDWENNLLPLQEVLRETNSIVLQRTDSIAEPLLDTPNLRNYRGITRWILLPRVLENAINAGRFTGITCKWRNLGGVSIFEMHANHSVIVPCYMHEEDDVPRESHFRQIQRAENAFTPLFKGFEDFAEFDSTQKINLLLVHGGKSNEFAYLRAYYDKDRRSVYRPISENIMHMATLVNQSDAEFIAEPEIKFNADTKLKVSKESA